MILNLKMANVRFYFRLKSISTKSLIFMSVNLVNTFMHAPDGDAPFTEGTKERCVFYLAG